VFKISDKRVSFSGKDIIESWLIEILGERFLGKTKITPSSLIIFALSGVFLLMVQFGVISPTGLITITIFQYIWMFWFSVVFFIISTANLVVRIPAHSKWYTGYSGMIDRTVKLAGTQKDYFIRGASETPIKEVLLKNWPFSELDQDSNWHVVDDLGNDVTNNPLSSLGGAAIVVIEEDT